MSEEVKAPVEAPAPIQTVSAPAPIQTVSAPAPIQTVSAPAPIQTVSVETASEAPDEADVFAQKDKGYIGCIVVLALVSLLTVLLLFGVLYYYNLFNSCRTNLVVYCPEVKCNDGSDPVAQATASVEALLNQNKIGELYVPPANQSTIV